MARSDELGRTRTRSSVFSCPLPLTTLDSGDTSPLPLETAHDPKASLPDDRWLCLCPLISGTAAICSAEISIISVTLLLDDFEYAEAN